MSHLAIYVLALASLRPAHALGGGLADLASFPKYQVQFLDDLPLAFSDAERVQRDGLGTDDEWARMYPGRSGGGRRGAVEGADGGDERDPAQADGTGADSRDAPGGAASDDGDGPSTRPRFLPLYYRPVGTPDDTLPHTYLCALPSENATAHQLPPEEKRRDEPEPDPVASWQALSHLDGKCLYSRHSWFTYAYCHNRYIRQFRELEPRRVLLGADEEPREDRTYAGYTLGLAQPPKRRKEALPPGQRRAGSGSADKAVELSKRKGGPDTHALAPEKTATFGQGPASRYLVQHWRDGTPCDKTGRPREVEVQVHCAMGSADIIYDVREVATCQYTVVIHSPHLCSLPGFHPESDDDITPAPIRCREVVSDDFLKHWLQVQENQRLLRLPEQRERESGERGVQRDSAEPAELGESGEPGKPGKPGEPAQPGEPQNPGEPGEQGEGEPNDVGSPETNDATAAKHHPDSPADEDHLAALFLDALGENLRTLNGRLEADLVRQIDAMLKHKAAGGAGQGQGQRRPRGQGAPHPGAAGGAGGGAGGTGGGGDGAGGEAEAKVIVLSMGDGNDDDRRKYLRQLMGSVQRELDELEGREGKEGKGKEAKQAVGGRGEGEGEVRGQQGGAEVGAADDGVPAPARDEL